MTKKQHLNRKIVITISVATITLLAFFISLSNDKIPQKDVVVSLRIKDKINICLPDENDNFSKIIPNQISK